MIAYETYRIVIEKKAQKFLEDLPKKEYEKVVLKVKGLISSNLQSLNIKKLQGYKNLYRLRIDDYRAVFAIILDKKLILITLICPPQRNIRYCKKNEFLKFHSIIVKQNNLRASSNILKCCSLLFPITISIRLYFLSGNKKILNYNLMNILL